MSSRTPTKRTLGPRSDTAERIEAAAVDAFFREGYPKTSIREITSALELTPGAFYNHYASKEELLLAIVSKTHQAIEDVIEAALLRSGQDPVRQMWEVIHALVRFYVDKQKEAAISRLEWHRLPDPHPAEILAIERRIRRSVERIIEHGIEQDAFHLVIPSGEPADVPVATKAILDQIINAGTWFKPGAGLSITQLADQYTTLILQMCGVDQAQISEQFAALHA